MYTVIIDDKPRHTFPLEHTAKKALQIGECLPCHTERQGSGGKPHGGCCRIEEE